MKQFESVTLILIILVLESIAVTPSYFNEDTSAITSANIKDPSTLMATLLINNSSNSHDLILYSYSTDNGSHLTGLKYPLDARISLPSGSYIKVVSGNLDFNIVATEVALYKNGDGQNPIYPQPATGGRWYVNATPGIYRLNIKSEYTPSNDDVATFVDTIQILGKSTAKDMNQSLGQTPFSSNVLSNNPAKERSLGNQQSAGSGAFKIIVQLKGANQDKHDKLIFVTSNPTLSNPKYIQSKIINFDPSKTAVDSSYSTTFELKRDTIKPGQKFLVCLVSLQPLQTPMGKVPIVCKSGYNSPVSKPEVVLFRTVELR
ncbi:MAG: hypothetical protein ACM3JQ_03880 [Candidatus Eiseniibacteriota bacterium]